MRCSGWPYRMRWNGSPIRRTGTCCKARYNSAPQARPNRVLRWRVLTLTGEGLTDEIRIHPGHRLHGRGFDFVIDDGSACLTQTAEDAFDDDIVAFPHFRFS